MRPAAARLIVFGAEGAGRRFAGIAAGIALGTGMVLILLGAYLHMPDRDNRTAWSSSAGPSREYGADGNPVVIPPSDDTVLAESSMGFAFGAAFDTVVVASTPNTQVAFPAGLTPPGPGEYYVSPALADLIASHPHDQLGARFGTSLGELPQSMLKGPDQLIVLMGAPWEELSANYGAWGIQDFPTDSTLSGSLAFAFRIIVAIGSVALLVPTVLLVSIVSQLGAAARRERYATVRLIGAGQRAMARLAALEMGAAALVGALAGIGVAFALRPAAALLPINGATSFLGDITPSAWWIAAAVAGMTLLAAATAWWRALRDEHGALGATRDQPEKPATARRLIVLLAGFGLFTGSALLVARPTAGGSAILLGLALGFALIALGIVIAGSWLTRAASRVFAKSARTAPALVAAGRLSRHPRATFRSVAGVVVAVFVVSVLSGVVSSVNRAVTAKQSPGMLSLDAVAMIGDGVSNPDEVADAVRRVEGVTDVVIAWRDQNVAGAIVTAEQARLLGATAVPDASYVSIDLYEMLSGDVSGRGPQPPVAVDAPQQVDVDRIVALTDGSDAAIERARTALEVASGPTHQAITRVDYADTSTLRTTYQLSILAYIGMAIAAGISALSLTVATVSAALDRKRTFGLLRLGGMPAKDLRKTIAYEAALPLSLTLIASGGLGFAVAYVVIRTVGTGLYFTWPDPLYWWALVGSLGIAAAAVSSSFRTVRRSTEIVSTRFE